MKRSRRLLMAGAMLIAGGIQAVTRTWSAGGTLTWADPASWGGNPVPGAEDVAVFGDAGLPSGCVVTLGATRDVGQIDLQSDTAFTLGATSDVTARHLLQVAGLGRSNVTAAVSHTLATDLALRAAETVFDLKATQGLVNVTGLVTNGPSGAARLVIRGPGCAYFNYRTTASVTAAHTGGTLVCDGAELRIGNQGIGNPQKFWFGPSPAPIAVSNATLHLTDGGGTNGGINNDIIVQGVGTISSSHPHVESGTGRSCHVSRLYLDGHVTLVGRAVSLLEGTNSPTAVTTLLIDQTAAGTRRVTQLTASNAPNRHWSIAAIQDSSGGAGNMLELCNTGASSQPLFLLDSPANSYAGGTRILDDGVEEDLVRFSHAVESSARSYTGGASKLGTGPVIVEAGGLLVLRYNRRNSTAAFTPVGIAPAASLTADGTVFFGGRGARYGTSGDFMQAAFDGLSGDGRVVISHMRLRIGQANGTFTFGGTILDDPHGPGGMTNMLVKVGSGTWTLAGVARHGGGTIVSNGTLRVDGELSGSVLIAPGATVEGSGTLALSLDDASPDRVTCGGTLQAGDLNVSVTIAPGTRATRLVLIDAAAGTLHDPGGLQVTAPAGWVAAIDGKQVLLRKSAGSVLLVF